MKDRDRYGDAPWYRKEVDELKKLAERDPEEYLKKLENSGSVIFSALLNSAAANLREAWGMKAKPAKAPARAPEPEVPAARRRRRKRVI